jgi:hypothetical protein
MYLIKHHTMKTYERLEVQFHAVLTSALDGGEWSASHPIYFIPGKRAHSTHWIGDWMRPRACLDVVARRKTFLLANSIHVSE